MNQTETDEVVGKVFSCFDKLMKKGKPTAPNEWTTLAAFVLKIDCCYDVVSLATGTSCVSASKLEPNGHRVSDSHAETLVRRCFQRYITDQISRAYKTSTSSILTGDRGGQLRIKDNVEVIFVITQTPCGDCSIFPREDGDIHPSKRRKLSEATTPKSTVLNEKNHSPEISNEVVTTLPDIYRTGAKCVPGPVQDPLLDGADYHVMGPLRIKPGRGDRTRSLSCSDKLARWITLGCQGCLPMLILSKPIYINHIIVTGCPYNETAMKRGLCDRFGSLNLPTKLYSRHMPYLRYSDLKFKHSKQSVEEQNAGTKLVACFSSIIYVSDGLKPDHGQCEAAVDGYKLGVTKKCLSLPASRLMLCRSEMVKQFLSALLDSPENLLPELKHTLNQLSYSQLKSKASYSEVWGALQQSNDLYKLWPVKDKKYSEFCIS